jgi:hypothetical protein
MRTREKNQKPVKNRSITNSQSIKQKITNFGRRTATPTAIAYAGLGSSIAGALGVGIDVATLAGTGMPIPTTAIAMKTAGLAMAGYGVYRAKVKQERRRKELSARSKRGWATRRNRSTVSNMRRTRVAANNQRRYYVKTSTNR